MDIDHRGLFKPFLFALLGYALLWVVWYAGYYLFEYWGSLSSNDLMSMLLIFWVPVLLFFFMLVVVLFGILEGSSKASPRSILLYVAILLVVTIYIAWVVNSLLLRGFT